MRERTRVACPETKEQVIEKWIKTWDVLVSLQQEVEELSKRMRTRILQIENNNEGTIPARTGVDAPVDLDARYNR